MVRAVTPRSRRPSPIATSGHDARGAAPLRGVRWLRPATDAPRAVALRAVASQLEISGPVAAAEWRAAQLVALLLGADLDGGPGSAAVRWDEGVPARPLELASRAGIPIDEAERAVARLIRAGALLLHDGEVEPRDGSIVRVPTACITDGPAAAVSWATVTSALAGSAAALLVARALADHTDRPGHPAVVPYSVLCRATRYSEGMIKRGVAAALTAGVVTQQPSVGRAPAYAFSDWALGRVDAPAPSRTARAVEPPALTTPTLRPPTSSPSAGVATGMLRASVAGIEAEIPAATGGELVVETVIDGRPVTARLIIPAARSQ